MYTQTVTNGYSWVREVTRGEINACKIKSDTLSGLGPTDKLQRQEKQNRRKQFVALSPALYLLFPYRKS